MPWVSSLRGLSLVLVAHYADGKQEAERGVESLHP